MASRERTAPASPSPTNTLRGITNRAFAYDDEDHLRQHWHGSLSRGLLENDGFLSKPLSVRVFKVESRPLVPGFFLVTHGQHQDNFGVNLVDQHIPGHAERDKQFSVLRV